jgi:uncharacterized membrane protein YgdD (TMEM256/DUF423 family)
MERNLVVAASVMGLLAVLAGTFAAHGLKGHLSAEQLEWYHTGAQYHMYHVLAAFAAAWASTRFHPRLALAAGWLFLAGALFFAGSLYTLALSEMLFGSTQRWLGAITPLGGLGFLGGWLCLALAAVKSR